MEKEQKHTARLALLLAFMVVMLVAVSIQEFRSAGVTGAGEQAAALRVYGN